MKNKSETEDVNRGNSQKTLPYVCADSITSSLLFYSKLNRSFLEALSSPFTDALEIPEPKKESFTDYREYQKYQIEYYKKYEKIIMAMIRDRFDRNFREERFSRVLSDFVDNNSTFAKMTGFGQIYQYASNFASIWNNIFIEPIRDTLLRTPSHKIYSENKYSLFHYDVPGNKTTLEEEAKETQRKEKTSAPVLIIYAFINRHYILDLVPGSSIVHNLQKHGLDMFATDWGNPSAYDKNLTLGHYVNNYLVDAIDEITKHTVADKYPCSATAGAEIWR